MPLRWLAFAVAMVAAVLPHRLWRRMPGWVPIEPAAFASGILTLALGVAIGLSGFLAHAAANVSIANQGVLDAAMRDPTIGYERGMVAGAVSLSVFSFLLLTPTGWLTLYLIASGGVRAGAVWFGDPVGDPLLTGLDEIAWRGRGRSRTGYEQLRRLAREGAEMPDRVVSGARAGMPGCDLVIVASRRKPGWERGVAVYTASACYRLGEPVERTIAGKLRTFYPLTEHSDLEVVRKSVQYDMPDAHPRD